MRLILLEVEVTSVKEGNVTTGFAAVTVVPPLVVTEAVLLLTV